MLDIKKENIRQLILSIIFLVYFFIGILLVFKVNMIENSYYYNLCFKINITMVVIILLFNIYFSKKIMFFLGFTSKKEVVIISLLVLMLISLANMEYIPYINTFGEQKEIIIETEIIKKGGGYKHNQAYIKLIIDGEPQEINVRHHNLKVGDIYKMKIYQGWLGIKYYKPNDGWGFYKSPYKVKKRKLDLKTLKYISEKEKD